MAEPADTPATDAGPGETVVIDRAGDRFAVSDQYVQQALADPAAGYHVETPEEADARYAEAKYGDRPVAAAAAGIARGLTIGLSDVALTKTGLVRPETLSGLRQHNEGVSAAGDVIGTVAPLLIPGVGEVSAGKALAGAGDLAARGAERAIGAGIAGKVAGTVARGAVEGSLYGVGNTLSDASLGDSQLTAEKFAANATIGALLGVGGSAIGEGMAAALRPVARASAAALNDLPEQVAVAARIRALKAAGAIQKDFNKLTEDQIQEIGQNLLDSGVIPPGASKAEILEKVKGGLKLAGRNIGDLLDEADNATGGRSFDLQRVVDRARKEVLGPIANDPALKGEAAKLSALLDDYEAQAAGGIDFAEANRFKSNLASKINKFVDTPVAQKYTKQLEGILNGEIESQMESLAPEGVADAFRKQKSYYGSFKKAVKWAKAGADREAGNRFISLSDYGVGGAAGLLAGGPLGVAASAAGALANKVARERSPSLFANALDALAKSPAFERLADSFSAFANNTLQQSPRLFGEYAPLLANAAARGNEDLLLTHAVLSERDPKYRDTMQAAGLDYAEDPSQVAQRAYALATMQHHLTGYDLAIRRNLDAFLNGGGEAGIARAMQVGQMTLDRFRELSERITDLAANPDALTERIGEQIGPLQDHAPNVATALATTATNAVGFLASKLPKPNDPLQSVPALRQNWQPSDQDRARFERYLRATVDPASVFDDMKQGQVTREAVEALQAVYPKLADSLRGQATDALAGAQKRLEYRKRIALGSLLGTPLAPSMQPQRIASIQAGYAAQPAHPQAPGGAQMKSAAAGMTESQRLEAK